tara:strand:- start:20085 stop:21275 length:1191 start_codon:yes stop_codon:yes gene_type:complete
MFEINKKLGYYTVNGVEFDSKIQACFFAQEKNAKVKWHFNDTVFKTYNWENEPQLSLDQLYDLRAKQLRDTYDYIILSYSGGSDSQNIVESFIRQGLHLDEIIVNTMEKANYKSTIIDPNNKDPRNAAAEHYLQTIPRLKEIEKRSPKTKITILDMSDYLFESWLSAGDASWIMDKKEGLNPLNVTRFNYIHFDETRKKFDRSKKLALVLGIEKPRTFIHSNGDFYIRFNDRSTNIITIENHIKEYDNSTVEYFYWAPESIDILCKQAHVIKKWLELNPNKQQYWYGKNMTADLFRTMHERELRPILYSTWDNSWYQADKATLDWYSEFDSWYIEGHKGTKHHDIWKQGIDYVSKHASNFINKDHGFEDGLQIHSVNYRVTKMDSEINADKLLWHK